MALDSIKAVGGGDIDVFLLPCAPQNKVKSVAVSLTEDHPDIRTVGQGAQIVASPGSVAGGAYTAGQCVGGIITLANILPANFRGVLNSLGVSFKASVQSNPFFVALFTANPAGTYGDKATPTWNANDGALLVRGGLFQMPSPALLSTGNGPFGTMTGLELDGIGHFIQGASTSLYASIIAAANTSNNISANEVSLCAGVLW